MTKQLQALSIAILALGLLSEGEIRATDTSPTVVDEPPHLSPPPAPGNWVLVFNDEFDGDSIDRSKWSETSSSLRDRGQGNRGQNNQIEWNTFANLEVSGGILTMRARREVHLSPSGWEYPWTGAMINSSPGFTFTYAYIEERSRLPLAPGFWPAFWTWQAPSGMTHQEVDVYEFWSGWIPGRYLSTTHPSKDGKWTHYKDHGTAADQWNVYGADVRPDGITFYLNGRVVHETTNAPSAPMNIISNLAVEGNRPPTVDQAAKEVGYIRAWKRRAVDQQ
jgi:beta-glucanase (GH16 family)